MKDIPVFTTEFGAASLILKEIPYRQEAYIRIQSSMEPEKLLEECVSFCRICGAEKIYASGDSIPEQYPLHTIVYEMKGSIMLDENLVPSMFPVTEQTVGQWRDLYNKKMRRVDNAATLESRDEKEILASGGAYFVHENSNLMGIGWMRDNELAAIASVQSGAGEKVLYAMQSIDPRSQIVLQVASSNEKAIALYEKLGFLKTSEISRWYCVFS